MAKTFPPPVHQIPSLVISPPILDSSPHPQDPSIAAVEPELVHITDSAGEEKLSPKKPPSPSPHEPSHDDFSIEFAQLQAKVASDREALKGVPSFSPLPTDPAFEIRDDACADPEVSLPPPPAPLLISDLVQISRLRRCWATHWRPLILS
jgi:hypothetical protein